LKRTYWVILSLFCVSILVVSAGCGKKGPPFLSQKVFETRVIQLMGEYEDGYVILKGEIITPRDQREKVSTVTGCRIYYAWYPLENAPCEDCPVQYADHLDVMEKVVHAERFHCRFPEIAKEGIYFFEVRLMDRDGVIGPPSNRVRLIIDQH
jgi:hypothetical protein